MQDSQRKIIHIDMDAFFASVEIRDNPSLYGKPVIVGGMPGSRGVVCTCSYEARRYGIHSAMSVNKAYELCPHGVFLPPRKDVYSQCSHLIRKIFLDYTDLVEPLSLDEAYLDVSTNKKGIPYASRTAKEIRKRIFKETGGLTASAGVSYNKFLAKMASDYRKPDGLTIIQPHQAEVFLSVLPIGKFYGVGRVTEKTFKKIGVENGHDLLQLPRHVLVQQFGKNGDFYYDIARGIDLRAVCPNQERKSIGTEETFEADCLDPIRLYEILCQQAVEISELLQKHQLAGRTVTLKLKFFDFRITTRSKTVTAYLNTPKEIQKIATELLKESDAGKIPVRLIGLTVSHFPAQDLKKAEFGGELYQPCFDFYEQQQ